MAGLSVNCYKVDAAIRRQQHLRDLQKPGSKSSCSGYHVIIRDSIENYLFDDSLHLNLKFVNFNFHKMQVSSGDKLGFDQVECNLFEPIDSID